MLEDLKHDVKKLDIPTGNVTTLKSYTHLVDRAEIRRGVNESMYLNWKAVFVPNKNGLTNYDISQGQIPIYQDELHVWYGATDGTPSFKTINIGGVNTNEGLPKQPYYVEKLSSYEKYLVNSVGKKRYELSDHLGNVRVVFSDLRIADADLDGSLDGFYTLDVKDWTDYYAFGSAKPNRKAPVTAESYRYGFNGMEKDDEVKGSGNSLDFGARTYDPRIGRFKSIDPLTHEFADMSPYAFAANNPIYYIDAQGLNPIHPSEAKKIKPVKVGTARHVQNRVACGPNGASCLVTTTFQDYTVSFKGVSTTFTRVTGHFKGSKAAMGLKWGSPTAANIRYNKAPDFADWLTEKFNPGLDKKSDKFEKLSSDEASKGYGKTFRHIAWQGFIAAKYGDGEAKAQGDYYESASFNADYSYGDLLNNVEGREFGLNYAKDHPEFWETSEGMTDFYNAAAQYVIDNTEGLSKKMGNDANNFDEFD